MINKKRSEFPGICFVFLLLLNLFWFTNLLPAASSLSALMELSSREVQSVRTSSEMKNYIFKLSDPQEIDSAIREIVAFSNRGNSSVGAKTVKISILYLSERIKYLSQTENIDFGRQVQFLSEFQKKIEDRMKNAPSVSAMKKISFSTNRITSRPSVRNDRLGFSVSNGKTHFSVYSPDATEIALVIFEKPEDKTGQGHRMVKDQQGIWSASVDGELYGKYYGFLADGPKGDGFLFDAKRLLSDPCALANVDHDGKSIILQTDFQWTDKGFVTPAAKDLVIYELHVKDLTSHSSSGVSEKNRGKYLGMLEGKGSDRILGHIQELGVNAVELLPCHEFDNNFAGHPNYWGYMTSHFFAPECSYASAKNGAAVKEFKQLVNGFHNAGIAVIMDVVYNHTTEGNEKGIPINFKGLDNAGYYRLTPDKKYYMNGTGCGNEFRSDNPMTRKYILDSLKYWVNEYHVDGFRFDLGTIIDKETMSAIIRELPPHVILVGEPWAADWERNQWGKGDFKNTKLGKWNDDFREKVRGFMGGEPNRNDLLTVLAGSCFWWAAKPTESVNYIECHDGATVFDLFKDKNRIKLGAVALLTAQGIPMIHSGQEYMKSKKGNNNSYDQDNDINWLNYSDKKKNRDIFDFYRGLIALRKTYTNFRHDAPMNDKAIEWSLPANHKALGYRLFGKTDFIVLMNSDSSEWFHYKLPDANPWVIVCNGEEVDDSGKLGTASGDYKVPPLTAVILKNK
ncbi:MAG: hypothetical protein HQM10_06480 [Candidatus Riflebacteria bacterium]|nr:hypothetical protein [Candidatus Riflebacteria bacterium]